MPKNYKVRNQFRFSKNAEAGYHPHYIFGERGDKYISLGMTSHPKKNHKVVLLAYTPNPAKNKKQYLHKKVFEMPKKGYEKKRLQGWSFSKEDLPLIRRFKKRYRKSK